MRYSTLAALTIMALSLSSTGFAKGPGKGYMGGSGRMVDTPPTDTGGTPGDVDGPINDKGSTKGQLYGDLYRILRYKGGETKRVPIYNVSGAFQGWTDAIAVGGEPVLTENFVVYQDDETGQWITAPSPSQCVQPVASFKRWGDLSDPINLIPGVRDYSGIEQNRIPLIMSYDATWDRTEFAVGMVGRENFIEAGETWFDPNNGYVTYANPVPWTALVEEVSFGRLNQARAPEAVHQAAFDEAIASINLAVDISVDASGRIVLTKEVYDDLLVDENGNPLLLGTVDKAIDSPLENLALYLKVMKDGHIVTPGNERSPIDRSGPGGMPISMLLEMEDGPSTALRPTLTQDAIDRLRAAGLGHLVDVDIVTYYTYFEDTVVNGEVTEHVLHAALNPPSDGSEYEQAIGIIARDPEQSAEGADFEACASFLSAAADKTGTITVDHVVYLNSIMGLNKVVGTSEDGSIDYTKNPVFYNFSGISNENAYDREDVINNRGRVENTSGDPAPWVGGTVTVLQPLDNSGGDPALEGVFLQEEVSILDVVPFREYGLGSDGFPDFHTTAALDIAGFAQATDDDLSIINFVHTYQIPENR